MAKGTIEQLRDKGRVTRGWLGVSIQQVTPELAQSFGLQNESGALVADVSKESPAEKAGIKVGDVILEFDGKPIHEMNELPRLVAMAPPGRKATVTVLRGGKKEQLVATVERLKDTGEGSPSGGVEQQNMGMTVRELGKDIAARLGVQEGKGVYVAEVKPGGKAEEAGIVPGDVIVEVNGITIAGMPDYEKALAGHKQGSFMRLLLWRGGSFLFVAIKVD